MLVVPAADLTCSEDFVAEGRTFSSQLTKTLHAPNQEAALLQSIQQTRSHGDGLSTKRLSMGMWHRHKQVHDGIGQTAQHQVHLPDPAIIALLHSHTRVGSRSLHRTFSLHLPSPNNEEDPIFAFLQEAARKGEECILEGSGGA